MYKRLHVKCQLFLSDFFFSKPGFPWENFEIWSNNKFRENRSGACRVVPGK